MQSTSSSSTVRSRRAPRQEDQPDQRLIDFSPSREHPRRKSPIRSTSNTWSSSFSSFSSFSDLATSVFNNDTIQSFTGTFSKKPSRKSSPRRPITPQEWGPTGLEQSKIGAGSQEARVSKIREAKRKAMLDGSTRIKRKGSDDLTHQDPIQQDALAYLHHVQPGDTMAGLTIKYNCSAQVLRKANRMWPNDPIQSRKQILIPVDACAIKGAKVDGPDSTSSAQQVDLLTSDESLEMHSSSPEDNSTNGWAKDFNLSHASSSVAPSSPTQSNTAIEEPPWKHDSWVLLPSSNTPTQIVRLSRQSLSYFPRPRRKSTSFSDLDSRSQTTSFDISRPLPPSSNPSPKSPPPLSRTTTTTTTSRPSSKGLAAHLHGPGGVGTLDRTTRAPGPGKERLTEMFAPNAAKFVAPPDSITVYTPWTPALLAAGEPSGNSIAGPQSGTVTPIQNAGGGELTDISYAVETWLRKAAKKAGGLLEEAGRGVGGTIQGMSPRVRARRDGEERGNGEGDLIELVDGLDLGPSVTHGMQSSSMQSWSVSNGNVDGQGIRGRKGKKDV